MSVTISDWLIIAATLLGPIFAVQAQKWVERAREKRNRKRYIFETLTGSRGEVLSYEHKRALNQIDLVFAGDARVIDAWHSYFDHLSMQIAESDVSVEMRERTNRLKALLKAMSASAGYDIDDRTIERGYYVPQGHINLENDQDKIRKGLIAILDGEPLNMNVIGFPVDDHAAKSMQEFHDRMIRAIRDGKLQVSIVSPHASEAARERLATPPWSQK